MNTLRQATHWIEEVSYDGFPRPITFYTAWCGGPTGTFMLNGGHHWKDRNLAQRFLMNHHNCHEKEVSK